MDGMPSVSQRGQDMPPSPIRKLLPFADKAKAAGTRVIHLNIGQPDIQAPEEFWTALAAGRPRVLEYSNSSGNPSLRKKMAAKYSSWYGKTIEDVDVMVTTAGSEAICFAMLATCNPGDEVIVPEPFYANYLGFAMTSGVTIVPITTYIEDDFALPSAEDFAAKITPRTKAILICNPSNPTGTIYDRAQLEALRDIALAHDLYLIADEVYREFNYTDGEMTSVLQLEGLEKHAIMVDSVSKRFSLCGARLGFLVTKNTDLMAAVGRFGMARLSPPGLAQIGVEGALEAPPEYYAKVREEYMARRDALVGRLQAMDGVLCPKIDGAFYATVRFPIDNADAFCQWLLESFSHNGATVMLSPASGFYATPGLGLDEVRIAYVLEIDRIHEAMDCLEVALATYPGRTLTTAG